MEKKSAEITLRKKHIDKFYLLWLVFPLEIFWVMLGSFFHLKNPDILMQNAILSIICGGTLMFVLFSQQKMKLYPEGVTRHWERYFLFYLGGMFLSVLFSFLPPSGWAYPVVFLALTLYSNLITGMVTGTVLLLNTVMLSGTSLVSPVLIVLVCSLFLVSLFQNLEKERNLVFGVIAGMVCLFAGSFTISILVNNDRISWTLCIVPILNVLVNSLCIVPLLNAYSNGILHQEELKYMEINDQLCPLLIALKEKSVSEYYHAIHTAFFCNRLAEKLNVHTLSCRAGGFYHHIGLLYGENSWENIESICQEYEFPPEAVRVLKEYSLSKNHIISKETAILLLADTIVSTITYLIHENPEKKPDINLIIPEIIRKRVQSPMLRDSALSMRDIRDIEQIFLGEKLYYDFLR